MIAEQESLTYSEIRTMQRWSQRHRVSSVRGCMGVVCHVMTCVPRNALVWGWSSASSGISGTRMPLAVSCERRRLEDL